MTAYDTRRDGFWSFMNNFYSPMSILTECDSLAIVTTVRGLHLSEIIVMDLGAFPLRVLILMLLP